MKKYITLFSSWENAEFTNLQVNHSIWGTPLRYSDDVILAAFQLDSYTAVYDVLDEAVASLVHYKYAVPVFEVELLDSSELMDSEDSKSGDINTYKMTSPHNIKKVISATHAGITYDLSMVVAQRAQLVIESNKLIEKSNAAVNGSELKSQMDTLRKRVWALKGKESYAELTTILQATNEFLDNPSAENLKKYKALAKTQQGAPSPVMQAVGGCMLALAAIVVAMGLGMILGVGIGLVGCGLFAAGRREIGVYNAMKDLSASVSPSM